MNRRAVLSGATVGLLGFLAGCIGGPNSPDDDSSPTGSNGGSSSATSTVTPDSIETADRANRTASPANTGTATARSPAPQTAPAGPTNVEMTTRTGVLAITEIDANPPGNDRQKLFRETIVFENTGDQELDITGYTVDYGETGQTYTYSESYATTIPPGTTFELVTGNSGETIMLGEYDSFAGFDEPALSNDGGTITVTDANGNVVLEATYSTEYR